MTLHVQGKWAQWAEGILFEEPKSMFFLGIDVSKAKLNCALLSAEGDKRKTKVVPNTAAGIQALVGWCAKQGATPEQLHAVLEPTGPYHEQEIGRASCRESVCQTV